MAQPDDGLPQAPAEGRGPLPVASVRTAARTIRGLLPFPKDCKLGHSIQARIGNDLFRRTENPLRVLQSILYFVLLKIHHKPQLNARIMHNIHKII